MTEPAWYEQKDGPETAMQTRCPHCLHEQYSLNVFAFSHGESPCHLCGKFTTIMTYRQWGDALNATRAKRNEQKQ